jgi:hypothetical protein
VLASRRTRRRAAAWRTWVGAIAMSPIWWSACQGVALDVFRNNFVELGRTAADIARGRAERLTDEFLVELERRLPAGLQAASDPDMQRALFNAQSEYACSGEADLQNALVDLLVDRAAETGRGTRTVVLNEAITSAPKLTTAQRRAIAVCFITKYTGWRAPLNVDHFYAVDVDQNILRLADELPRHQSAYQHIDYVGAGSVGIGDVSLGRALLAHAPGCFTRGFTREEFPTLQDLLDDGRLIGPCIRDDSRFQILVMHPDQIEGLATAAGMADRANDLAAAFPRGQLAHLEIEDELVSRLPQAAELLDAWRNTALKDLTLTSVGIAIGHGYWRRVTSGTPPLSIWITD